MDSETRLLLRQAISNRRREVIAETEEGHQEVLNMIRGYQSWWARRNPDKIEHGTMAKWRRGCRCEKCKTARRVYNRQWTVKRKERREQRRREELAKMQ